MPVIKPTYDISLFSDALKLAIRNKTLEQLARVTIHELRESMDTQHALANSTEEEGI